MLRRHVALIFTPEDRAAGAPEAETRIASAEGTAEDERWHVRRDGVRFWGSGQLTPLHEGGGLVGYLNVCATARRDTGLCRTCGRPRAGASA